VGLAGPACGFLGLGRGGAGVQVGARLPCRSARASVPAANHVLAPPWWCARLPAARRATGVAAAAVSIKGAGMDLA
jgi:hypothetical protein